MSPLLCCGDAAPLRPSTRSATGFLLEASRLESLFKMFKLRLCWHLVVRCPQTASTRERFKRPWALSAASTFTGLLPDTQQLCCLWAVLDSLPCRFRRYLPRLRGSQLLSLPRRRK